MSSEYVIVATTTDSEEKARTLAASVVDAHLGACAQITSPITSVYRWQGNVQTDQEWRVEIKTAADRVEALVEHINGNHSYDLPEVVVTPIIGGSAAYLDWLGTESRG
ncbi:divalent-cation tolerance protein CutA [Lentzea sp. JNUCC 0626]|uniref:divalent-cation tolerance protein CutA n=1 Tax=Lentzea sp. JNUCC 0626 TaxID=3367513 RepID=UPI0037483939